MITLNSGVNNFSLILSDKKVLNSNNFIFVFTHSLTGREVICLPTLISTSRVFFFELTLSDTPNPSAGIVNLQAGYWEYEIYQSTTTNLDKTGTIILKGRVLVEGESQVVSNIANPTVDGLSPIESFCDKLSACESFIEVQTDITQLQTDVDTLTSSIDTIEEDITAIDGRLDTLENEFDSFVADPNVPHIDFNTATTSVDAVGRLKWNDADGTLEIGLKGGNVTLQIGQEEVVRGVNKTGINLLESNYQAIRLNGAQGNRVQFALAQANSTLNSSETIGLVTENINNNQEGFVTTFGLVRNINTTGSLQGESWNDGDVLYLSPTTAGRITKVRPTAPNKVIVIGYVVRAHNTQGKIFVKVTVGLTLEELNNVSISNPLNNAVIKYNSALGIWVNDNTILDSKFDKSGGIITGNVTLQPFATTRAPLGVDNGVIVALNRSGTFATRPSTPFVGQMYFATDIGTNGTLFIWNGTIWRADNPITYLDNTTYTTAEISGTIIVKSQLIPAGILQPNSIIEVEVLYQHTYVSGNQLLLRGFLETTSTGQSNIIYTAGVSATNALQTSMVKQIVNRNSLTNQLIRYSTNGLVAIAGTQATTALPTLTLNTANDVFFNFSINRNNGNAGNTANLVMTKILIYQ